MRIWTTTAAIALAFVIAQIYSHYPGAFALTGLVDKLVVLAVVTAGVLLWAFRDMRFANGAVVAAVMVGVVGGAIWGANHSTALSAFGARIMGATPPTVATARREGHVQLRKAWDGHFRAVAQINGAKVGMLIDTGASMVLLTYEDAAAVGLAPEALDFDQPVITANGKARVATVLLDSVNIGEIGLAGVRAAIAQKGALHSSLLGMSFLNRLQEISFQRDTLVLRN